MIASSRLRLLAAALLVLATATVLTVTGRPQSATANNPSSVAVRGVAGDYWADAELGQPSFAEVTPYKTVDNKLYLPHGVVVDRRPGGNNNFYVYDAGNNRILGFNGSCLNTPPCTASKVLGQPNSNTAGCNGDSGYQDYPSRSPATAFTLCGENEAQLSISEGGSGSSMSIDGSGNLYVNDFDNNRVLKYNNPFAPGEDIEADDVWGQADFTGVACNRGLASPTANTLCFNWGNSNNWTAGVDVQADGTLWIVDSGNERVLRFTGGSHTADLVLGQQNFTNNTSGTAPNQMDDPNSVRVANGWVYVAEHKNNRVDIFQPPLATGMTALIPHTFNMPSGVDTDPTESGVWIMNEYNRTLELWNYGLTTLIKQIGYSGQGNLLDDASGSVGIDSGGNVAVAIGRGDYTDDVILFRKNGSGYDAPVRLFNANVRTNTAVDFAGVNVGVQWSKSPGGGSQLIVADNGRVLYYNNPNAATINSATVPDGYLDWLTCGPGGTNCHSAVGSVTATDGACCAALKVSDGYLWVSMYGVRDDPNRILAYTLPLSPGQLPTKDLRLPLQTINNDTIVANSGAIWGVVPSADSTQLWLSQSSTNRVFRVRNPLLSDPRVDVVLGQPTAATISCNTGGLSASSLCLPGSLSLDRLGNLYVSDASLEYQGNFRLLEYNANLFPANNASVLFATAASKTFSNVATWEPAFSRDNHMVVGYNPYHYGNPEPAGDTQPGQGWFPGVYNDPLTSAAPENFLKDYYSMAFSASFDENDNLYVADLNRGQIRVYRQLYTPDLSVSAVWGDTRGWSTGGQSTLAHRAVITNSGTATSAATTLKVWLSTNATLDGGDTLVATVTVPAIAPGAQAIVPYSATVNWTAASGRVRYLISQVDPDNTVAESNEANNTRAKTVGVSLLPYDVSGDGTVNVLDLSLVSTSTGATPSSVNWNPDADVDGDGTVTILDLSLVSAHYGDSASHVEGHLSSSVTTGSAPLAVTFTYSGHYYEGTVTLVELDFNGDGVYDQSIGGGGTVVSGTAPYTFNSAGTYIPKIRATDSNGYVDVSNAPTITVTNSQTLRPNANGTYLEWGELWGSGTTHYDRVSEVIADDLGSYIMDNSWNGTERDTFQLSDTTYTSIGYVEVWVRAFRITDSAPNNNVKLFIRSGSTDAESAAKTLSGSWGYVSERWTTDPATGAAWTPAAVNGLQAGMRNAMSGSGGGGVAVTQVYVIVAGS